MLTIRKKSRWQTQGKEPDYRFSLANERTFLAWTRTSLAVLAAAILIFQMDLNPKIKQFTYLASFSLLILSVVISITAYFRWRSHQIAMRHDQPLNSGTSLLMMAILSCLIAAGLCFLIFNQ
jgi:putative membrane protein